jgi:pimeloyl-ACP methyl ester carboxylesterase
VKCSHAAELVAGAVGAVGRGVAALLGAGEVRVTRFDNRDVGLSQKFVEGGYTLTDMACDTAVLLTALDIERAHVVRQSMGGMIASALGEAP